MNVLGLMQCQWFARPNQVKQMLASEPDLLRRAKLRSRLIEYALFAGCKSGRVLKQIFGQEICERITWEESTKEIGGHSSSVFPPDIGHIQDVLLTLKPNVIITFGTVARKGLIEAMGKMPPWPGMDIDIVYCPHPAARHPTAIDEMKKARFELEQRIRRQEIRHAQAETISSL